MRCCGFLVNLELRCCRKSGVLEGAGRSAAGSSLHLKIGQAQVDVVNPRCRADGCKAFARLNWAGEHARLYCKLHASPGMVRPSTVNQAQSQMQNSIMICGVNGD